MITEINRQTTRMLVEQINMALKEIGERHGVVIQQMGGARFCPTGFTMKIQTSVVTEHGIMTEQAKRFRAKAPLWGLKPDDLGAEFTSPSSGKKFKITGASRGRTYPILADEVGTGKSFKFGTDYIRMVLGREFKNLIVTEHRP